MKMNHREALKVMGLKESAEFSDIKAMYRHLSSKYHPDRNPAGLEMMKLINNAYSALSDYEPTMQASECVDNEEVSLSDELNAALNAVISLGLTIEICGSWIWLSGDTRPHKTILKESGYRWAPVKKMWCFSVGKSYGRGKFSMDEIRATHGSNVVKGKTFERLSA